MNNANALLLRLNDLVAENQESIHKTLTNVESVTTMLDQRKDDIVEDHYQCSGGGPVLQGLIWKA